MFYGHSPPSPDSRRVGDRYKRKYVSEVDKTNILFSLFQIRDYNPYFSIGNANQPK